MAECFSFLWEKEAVVTQIIDNTHLTQWKVTKDLICNYLELLIDAWSLSKELMNYEFEASCK